MSVTVAQLVANVLSEGSFDATEAQALQWLSRRQEQMCARTRCYRKEIAIGPTVAEQNSYAMPAEVVEVRELQVNGYPYGEGRHSDLAQGKLGYLWLSGLYYPGGMGGIYVRGYSSTGERVVSLYPTPTEASLPIAVFAVCYPPDLVAGQDGTLVIPSAYADGLVAGAIGTGMSRVERRADLAANFEAIYSAACSELEQQVDKELRGSGAAQIRVAGYQC